jgi:MFS family permease
VTFAVLERRLPRAGLLWCSAAGATVGAGLFAASHAVAPAMAGAVVLGFAGTTLLTCTQAILSDRHGERRDRALTEANVGAAACAVLAPLVLGLLQSTPARWRAAMGLPVLLFAGLYLRYRRQPLPTAPAAGPAGGCDIPSHDPRDTLHWHPVSAGPILAGESHECRVAGHGVSQALVFQLG